MEKIDRLKKHIEVETTSDASGKNSSIKKTKI
jgi:hypothetical protein